MKVSIYNPDMVKIADIGDRFISCLWREDYNGDGAFSLELPATEQYTRNITPDCYARRQDRPGVMVIKSINSNGRRIVLSGKTAASLLDDIAFIGSTAADAVISTTLKNAYDASTGYRNITYEESELTDTYGDVIKNVSVYEMQSAMCKSADIGYRAVKSGSGIKVQLYKPGVNPYARFSHFLGNLKNSQVNASSIGYKNYAIVLGENSNGAQKRVDVDLSDGGQRREIIISGQNQDSEESASAFLKRLRSIGENYLAESRKELNVTLVPSTAGFGSRFDLGDVATIILDDYGIKLQARIISFSEKSQNNKTETTIEVGTPTIISR